MRGVDTVLQRTVERVQYDPTRLEARDQTDPGAPPLCAVTYHAIHH